MKNGKFINEIGTEIHYKNGKKHRIDGPAVIFKNGIEEYWKYGCKVTKFSYKIKK